MAEPLLSTDRLVKRFGGLLATDSVSIDVRPGEIHALIGPNGAGKTTLVSQLTGNLRPDAGTIHFAGRDVTRLPTHARVRLGLARSFQITSVLREFTALDNVALAVQAHAGHSFRFLADASRDESLRRPARQGLAEVGLARARRRARRQPQPWRAAPARDRHGAGRRSPPAAARRADGRHGRGGIAAPDRLPARLQGQARHAADRARHGCRVPARRPHHRAGLWPRHRQRHARGDPRQSPTCARPISARRSA